MSDQKVQRIIERALPNGVIYDMSTAGQVRITLPTTSTRSSGLHWHETHDEYLKVVQGTIMVRLDDSTKIISAAEGNQPEIKVARYVWHEWQRAGPDGEEVVVVERTEPDDNDKSIFFWNLNGVILNAPKMLSDESSFASRLPTGLQGPFLDFWIALNLFVIFRSLDNLPVFLNAPGLFKVSDARLRSLLKMVDWLVSHVVLLIAYLLGKMAGIQPVRSSYTPDDAYAAWQLRRQDGKKRVQTVVFLPRPDEVVNNAEDYKATSDHNAVVHHVNTGVHHGRKEAEESDNNEVAHGENVVGDTKSTLDVEWSPDKLSPGGIGQRWQVGGARKGEALGSSAIQEKAGGDEI
ncbi:hypothetical protein HG530_002728 [Fusarium avenaceum]|nr:hypothetical protein HG530_002728 [Fusarium avenaceum]